MGVSNNITAVLNFISLLCSIPIISSGVWLASKADTACVHWLRWPVVLAGVAVLLLSLAGFVGAYWNKSSLLAIYLLAMAALIVTLLILVVLAFVVSHPDGAVSVPGRNFREYRLSGFSPWLRNHITNSENWGKIRACLAESDFCPNLNQKYISAEQFFGAHISPLQASLSPCDLFVCLFAMNRFMHWAFAYKNAQTEELFRRYKQGWV
ncbi:Tetraspanin-2 like [Actinidia chinensis var. chinensis]|uniref:Tetraspanin-2 like n=1 Tax=Actinidia chinensis var. chinensis TaxID=1590841 RepID=A0A2R6R4A1_ACTCC|nr:Tetraspanin-2 like [Actinidia chinensis var. chinensis]